MYFVIPEEKRRLQRVYKPYLEGVRLKENAPKEAIEAYNEFNRWFAEMQGDEQ